MSEDNIIQALREAQRARALVSLHTDYLFEGTSEVGFVLEVQPPWFAMARISPEGCCDGTLVARLDDIRRLETDSRYLRQIALLAQANNESHAQEIENLFRAQAHRPPDVNLLVHELRIASTDAQAITVMAASGDLGFSGFPAAPEADAVRIEQLNDDGEPDGTSVIKLADIARLVRAGRYEKRLALYFRHKDSLYRGRT